METSIYNESRSGGWISQQRREEMNRKADECLKRAYAWENWMEATEQLQQETDTSAYKIDIQSEQSWTS